MISRGEILRDQVCPPELEENLQNLLLALNKFREVWGHPMIVTSGYRSAEHNQAIGGAQNSAHLYCQAADISDPDRILNNYIESDHSLQATSPRDSPHISILETYGLWMEDPLATPTWVHLQIRPTISRIFKP